MVASFLRKPLGAIAVAATFLFAASAAHAGIVGTNPTNTPVTVNLTGTVNTVCTVSNAAGTTTFNDLTQAQSGVTIATITETCNDTSGYHVTLGTANFNGNSANFKGGASNYLIPYTLTYGGNAVSFTSATPTITTVSSLTGATAQPPKALVLSDSAQSTAPADNYSDTLTITMVAQ